VRRPWDGIDLAKGVGYLYGDFAVVTHGDNPVDGPEAVITKGTFNGEMDLRALIGSPLGFPSDAPEMRAHRDPPS
jgi:hypothetical protein